MYGKKALAAALTIALTLAAIVVVEETRINHLKQEKDTEAILSDWQAAHVVIQSTNGQPYWFIDGTNPVEVNWTKRIKPLLLISADNGRILEQSPLYRSLRLPAPPRATAGPRIWRLGHQYVFCTGPMQEPDGKTYQLTIGKRL